MKQKGFIPILILVGILIMAILAGGAFYFRNIRSTQNTDQAIVQNNQEDITSAKVFYWDSSNIYMLNGINTKPEPIISLPPHIEGSMWSSNILGLSPDKKWLFYYTCTKEAAILVAYDVINKTEKVISKINTPSEVIRYARLWSPHGNYVIFSHYNYYGNAVGDNVSEVYSYPAFNKITSFYSYNDGNQIDASLGSSSPIEGNFLHRVLFLDDENIIYLDPVDKNPDSYGYLGSERQISLLNLVSGKTKTLVPDVNGLVLRLVNAKDNILYYFTEKVNSHPSIYKLYQMDLNDLTISEVSSDIMKNIKPDTTSINVDKIDIPSNFRSRMYRYLEENRYNKTSWIIFELMRPNDNTAPSIAILNEKDPKNTFKVIGQGYTPTW